MKAHKGKRLSHELVGLAMVTQVMAGDGEACGAGVLDYTKCADVVSDR